MTQSEKAKRFMEMHVKGAPVLLYNVWDAGSAKAVLDAGANAIVAGSHVFHAPDYAQAISSIQRRRAGVSSVTTR